MFRHVSESWRTAGLGAANLRELNHIPMAVKCARAFRNVTTTGAMLRFFSGLKSSGNQNEREQNLGFFDIPDDSGINVGEAPRYARAPSWPVAVDTESRLAAIAQNVDEPTALWVRKLVERTDPHARRNKALRDAARLVKADSVSRTAKDLEDYLRRYIAGMWLLDRDSGGPFGRTSQLRLALWRFVQANNGRGLSWRQILKIIDD
jgi:hypothetical protein